LIFSNNSITISSHQSELSSEMMSRQSRPIR